MSSVLVSAVNLAGAHAFLCSVLIDGQQDAQISEQAAAELHRIGMFVPADEMPEAAAYHFPLRDSSSFGTLQVQSGVDGQRNRLPLRLPAEWSKQALGFEPHHLGSVWAPVRFANDTFQADCRDHPRHDSSLPQMSLDEESTHAQFNREGYAILKDLLPAEHVTELHRYFQALAAQGFLLRDANDGIRRFFAHNHPVARYWHDQLNERVSQLAGRRTKPSYSYVSLYIAGGDLFWHTDRPPCEYTVALLLDYAPLDADGQSAWALKLKDRDARIQSMHQRVGEALIFRGRELMHGRDVLPDGHRSASMFFHFVNEEYDGEME